MRLLSKAINYIQKQKLKIPFFQSIFFNNNYIFEYPFIMFATIYNDSKKYWQGVPRVPLYNRDVSIGQVLLDALERQPNEIGQVY